MTTRSASRSRMLLAGVGAALDVEHDPACALLVLAREHLVREQLQRIERARLAACEHLRCAPLHLDDCIRAVLRSRGSRTDPPRVARSHPSRTRRSRRARPERSRSTARRRRASAGAGASSRAQGDRGRDAVASRSRPSNPRDSRPPRSRPPRSRPPRSPRSRPPRRDSRRPRGHAARHRNRGRIARAACDRAARPPRRCGPPGRRPRPPRAHGPAADRPRGQRMRAPSRARPRDLSPTNSCGSCLGSYTCHSLPTSGVLSWRRPGFRWRPIQS